LNQRKGHRRNGFSRFTRICTLAPLLAPEKIQLKEDAEADPDPGCDRQEPVEDRGKVDCHARYLPFSIRECRQESGAPSFPSTTWRKAAVNTLSLQIGNAPYPHSSTMQIPSKLFFLPGAN
jgi:hypothetical protein